MRRTFRCASVAIVAIAAATPALLTAQLPSPQPSVPVSSNVRFEVASVRSVDPSSRDIVLIRQLPGGFEAIGVPVRTVLRQALRVQDYQIIGAPDWVDSERYTIVAKAPEGAPQSGMPAMLTNLLKDRFTLVTHIETRQLPVLELILARNDRRFGPNLRRSSVDCHAMVASRPGGTGEPLALPGTPGGPPLFDPVNPPCGSGRSGPGILGGGGKPIAQLVQMLSQLLGRPVLDKTGLNGLYDFALRFATEPGMNLPPFDRPLPPPPSVTANPDVPSLYTALQEQLGLKLDNVRGPVEVVVVDRIERPTLE